MIGMYKIGLGVVKTRVYSNLIPNKTFKSRYNVEKSNDNAYN